MPLLTLVVTQCVVLCDKLAARIDLTMLPDPMLVCDEILCGLSSPAVPMWLDQFRFSTIVLTIISPI